MNAPQLYPPVSANDHAAGAEDAPVTLVEYGDYECPYCGNAYPIVKRIQKEMGPRLRFVFRNFPLAESHPHARHAAEAAEAAAAQGRFWEMHDIVFENQTALTDQNLIAYAAVLELDTSRVQRELETGTYTKRVSDDFRSGVRSGVNGTPTFFINGERYDGPWTDQGVFIQALREAAAQPAGAGSTPEIEAAEGD
jgi:protein-disulfide isomerase